MLRSPILTITTKGPCSVAADRGIFDIRALPRPWLIRNLTAHVFSHNIGKGVTETWILPRSK